jgi:hypothetical protein
MLVYPIPPAPRTAVLIGGFRSRGLVRVFVDGWTDETARFAPQSIAGRLDQLFVLDSIARPTHALIVIRREWERAVPGEDRDRLWRAFGVPLFEQIVDEDCALLAAECEAHEGLHIEPRWFAVGDHEIDRTPCGCGKLSPRLIERESLRRAASAG